MGRYDNRTNRVVAETEARTKPFAYCCAEAGGDVDKCDCVNKDHGVARFTYPVCLIPNCRNRAPVHEAFCAHHRGDHRKDTTNDAN